MSESRVSICVETGRERTRHVIAIPVSDRVLRELSEQLELSDDGFSVMLASPGMLGGHGDSVTIRKRVFKMREDFAKEIAATLVMALTEYFGRNDVTNGYTKVQLEAHRR